MAIKTFSVGEVLTATDTNTYLANSGLVYVGEFTASGTSRALVCDNVFTSTYSNYRIVISLRSTQNTNGCFFQYLDTSGTLVATNYYSGVYGQDFTTGATGFTGVLNSTTSVPIGWIPNSSTSNLCASIDVCNPRDAAVVTNVMGNHTSIASGASFFGGAIYSMTTTASAFRGLRFDNSNAGNLTGKVTVYGYRNG